MRRLLLAIVLAMGGAAAAAPQEVPTFTTGVESVYVDVWVGHGATPQPDLAPTHIEVKDNGVPQAIERVDTARVPVHAVLVLDTSASVAGAPLEALKGAARAFLEGLAPEDRATLVTFSHVRRLQGPVAGAPAAVAAALPGLSASGATALQDAVFTGLKLADPRRGRPVLMVFSDGEDRVSWLSAEAVEAVARESEAVIYVVDSAGRSDALNLTSSTEAGTPDTGAAGLRSQMPAPQGTGTAGAASRYRTTTLRAHETPVFLRHVVEQSGGQVWTAGRADRLGESFLAVLAHVKSRYLLRYEPSGVAREGWHKLEVTLRGKKGDVRARRGYSVARAQD
jgi:VWFA-related protein